MQPFDVINEQNVLGTLLASRDMRKKYLSKISEDFFIGPIHKEIFHALVRCDLMGLEMLPASLISQMSSGFEDIEFIEKLLGLNASENFEYHLQRLAEEKNRQKIAEEIEKFSEGLKVRAISNEQISTMINEIAAMARKNTDLKDVNAKENWEELFNKRLSGEQQFQTTGFDSLDSKLCEGFMPGGITIVGGRSRAGKSSLIIEIIARLLKLEKRPKILMVPLEGGPNRVVDSLISNLTSIPLDTLLKHPEDLTTDHKDSIKEWLNWIFEGGDITIETNFFGKGIHFGKRGWGNQAALDRVEEMFAKEKYDIVFWDLFERMFVDLDPQNLAAALFRMQNISTKYQIHNVLVQQLKRITEERKDHRPTLTDLKNSGAYEEVADLVLLVHREKIFKPFLREDMIEVTIAKQKRGEDNVTMLARFHPENCQITCDRIQEFGEKKEDSGVVFMEG